ncbi:MAG: carbon-nitrogen hydrolase family protein [Candidatus Binatia bacterium]
MFSVKSSPSVALRVAVVQNCATSDAERNVAELREQIHEAASRGARFIALPEACEFLHPDDKAFSCHARPLEQAPASAAMARAARDSGAWVLAGSLSVRATNGKLANRSVLYSPEGEIRATYDKINLFDAAPGEKESVESRLYERGDTAYVVDIGVMKLGLSICYDLRFPQLYRALARAGAQVLTVPSAFMQITGEAHWHTLLRARAIETGCYVLAPAQCGIPHAGRESYGHSLIVNPWGEVLGDAGTKPNIIVTDLDLTQVTEARRRIPSITQEFTFRVVTT